MSAAELRYWFKLLFTDPQYGWAGHGSALARALGFNDSSPCSSFKAKFRERNQAWIYPGEQLRFSRQLRKILDGSIVCCKVGAYYQAVVASDPRPLRTPVRFRYNLAAGGLEWVRVGAGPGTVLPSFQSVFAAAPRGHSMG
jgi:hypothetical protein